MILRIMRGGTRERPCGRPPFARVHPRVYAGYQRTRSSGVRPPPSKTSLASPRVHAGHFLPARGTGEAPSA